MTDPTADFFRNLKGRGHEPLLNGVRATVRFDISRDRQTSTWRVIVDDGDLVVSTDAGPADCVLAADRPLFDGLATGRVNAMAALLRGELDVSGDLDMMVALQRLFPGPAGRGGDHAR